MDSCGVNTTFRWWTRGLDLPWWKEFASASSTPLTILEGIANAGTHLLFTTSLLALLPFNRTINVPFLLTPSCGVYKKIIFNLLL